MFAVAIFSDLKNKPFVGLITDKQETAAEIIKVAEAAKDYTFIKAGSKTANEYLIRAYEILGEMAMED